MSYMKNLFMRITIAIGIAAAGLCVSSVQAADDAVDVSTLAGETKTSGSWLSSLVAHEVPKMSEVAEKTGEAAPEVAVEPAGKAWSVFMDYTLVSDYIWRGMNLSEVAGEGREKPNHMMTIGGSYDTGSFGTFSGSIWFEWWGLESTTEFIPEIDYTLSWGYDLSNLNENIPVSIELGYIWYTFPEAEGDDYCTQEWYISALLDDSFIFGTEESVLNPYVTFYDDVDDIKGSWLEFGMSHDFALASMGMADVAILKDITLTPSFVLGTDVSYIGATTRVAYTQYGLDLGYDLSSAFNIPDTYGALSLNGFLYYSDAVFSEALNDEFWGGVTLAWEF